MSRETTSSRRALALVVASGAFERVHYALVMASAAVATNRPVILFLTMDAIYAVAMGKSASAPGWHALKAGHEGGAAGLDAAFRARGVAGFEELLHAVSALGGRIQICEMGLKALDLAARDLRTDIVIGTDGGVVSLLAEADTLDAWLVFI